MTCKFHDFKMTGAERVWRFESCLDGSQRKIEGVKLTGKCYSCGKRGYTVVNFEDLKFMWAGEPGHLEISYQPTD